MVITSTSTIAFMRSINFVRKAFVAAIRIGFQVIAAGLFFVVLFVNAIADVLTKIEEGESVPEPSSIEDVSFEKLEEYLEIENWDYVTKFKTYIRVDISAFAEKWGKQLVKKTVNIPKWVNTKAEELKINFSKVLEEALLEKITKK